jgi:hypothetical protein
MAMLQSEDFMNATVAQATKSPPPTFSKLWNDWVCDISYSVGGDYKNYICEGYGTVFQ